MSLAGARRTPLTLTLGQDLLCRRATASFKPKSMLDTVRSLCRHHHSGWARCHDFTAPRLLVATAPNVGVGSHSVRLRLGTAGSAWSSSSRRLSRSACALQRVGAHTSPLDPQRASDDQPVSYHGPLTQTFRRLKLFSLASLGLTFTMTPFLFIVESSLPTSARIFLTATALSTSSISTALVGWCGAPYVVDLRRLTPAENEGIEGVEMTTLTLTLKKLTTRVYDADFLVETRRPFAKWELPLSIQLPPPDEDVVSAGKAGPPGEEETVAETFNDKGEVVGRWIVKWGEGGAGSCRGAGKILRYFNVHEELL